MNNDTEKMVECRICSCLIPETAMPKDDSEVCYYCQGDLGYMFDDEDYG